MCYSLSAIFLVADAASLYSSLPDSESELLAELDEPELELESELLLVPLPLLLLLSLSLDGRGSLPTTSTTEWSARCESKKANRTTFLELFLTQNDPFPLIKLLGSEIKEEIEDSGTYASRLLDRWVSRHPVDSHLLKKIVVFFICCLINCSFD